MLTNTKTLIIHSVASDSGDAESGFEETDPGELGSAVIRMVSRFVDRVCTEGGVSTEHVRCLHQMVPGLVHMHIETLEAVHRESKRLPPIQKVRHLSICCTTMLIIIRTLTTSFFFNADIAISHDFDPYSQKS
jgi:hypothetical protein